MKTIKNQGNSLCLSVIISMLTVFILPCTATDGFYFSYGFPIPFITFFPKVVLHRSDLLITWTNINIIGLLLELLIIFWIIILIKFLFNKIKVRKISKGE